MFLIIAVTSVCRRLLQRWKRKVFDPRRVEAALQLTPDRHWGEERCKTRAGVVNQSACWETFPPQLNCANGQSFFFSFSHTSGGQKRQVFNFPSAPLGPASSPRLGPLAPKHRSLFCTHADGTSERQHVLLQQDCLESCCESGWRRRYLKTIYSDRKRRPDFELLRKVGRGLICTLGSWDSSEMATCLDSVIWRDFQQPERSTTLGVLTSMQLPHRTVSFIMKGLEQASTQQDTRTRAHALTQSEVRCSQGDKWQAAAGEK